MKTSLHIERRLLPDRHTVVCRGTVPITELTAWLPGAWHAVADHLKRGDVTPDGPPFIRYTVLDGLAAVEAGYPVLHPPAGEPGIETSTLPGGPAAVMTCFGRQPDLSRAYGMIRTWLHTHGYTPVDPHWEVHHTDPVADPDAVRWQIEIVQPYRP